MMNESSEVVNTKIPALSLNGLLSGYGGSSRTAFLAHLLPDGFVAVWLGGKEGCDEKP